MCNVYILYIYIYSKLTTIISITLYKHYTQIMHVLMYRYKGSLYVL